MKFRFFSNPITVQHQGRLKYNFQTILQIPEGAVFKDVDCNKYSLRNAHKGHNPEDAVSYWNRCGRYYVAKSQAVRKWMLDPNNYRLEYGTENCSRGAKNVIRNPASLKMEN